MDKPFNFFPRTRKAMQLIEDVYAEYNDSIWDKNAPEFDEDKRPILDHSMMYLAQGIYDDNAGCAEDLYDYLGALIREEKRNRTIIKH